MITPLSQDPLETYRKAFEDTVAWGKELLQRLTDDGAELTHVRMGWNAWTWLLRAKLPTPLQEGYGTAPEVLILAVKGEVLARDIERARTELYQSGYRLDLDLLLVVDEHPNLESRLERLPGRWGQFVAWPPSPQFAPLAAQLAKFLPCFDLFEEKNPVRGRQVIGRQDETSTLATRFESGDCVGIFGLRKVGKTSVVRAVTDVLDPVSARLSMFNWQTRPSVPEQCRVVVCWLDVQRVFDRSEKRLFEYLAQAIESRFEASGVALRAPGSSSPLGRIDSLIKAALAATDTPLCIVLDEYDYLFEGSSGQSAIPGVNEFLRLFRGWSQETRRVGLALVGRDPEFSQRPEIGGFPNPLLGWVGVHWLGPLRPDRAPELIRKLGKRVGLHVGHTTASLVQEWTGGHPLLHRQFGSALLELAKGSGSVGTIETDPIAAAGAVRFFERDSVRTVCAEVVHLLRSRYPLSYQLLMLAAKRRPLCDAVAATGGWSAPAALTLRNFGVLQGSETAPSVYRALIDYARLFEPQPQTRAPQSSEPETASRMTQRHRVKNRRGSPTVAQQPPNSPPASASPPTYVVVRRSPKPDRSK